MKKKIASLMLILAMLLPSAAACSESGDGNSNNTKDTQTPENTETETAEPNILDGLNFNGRDFRIQMSATAISSDAYMHGSDEFTGDVVNDAVHSRNMAVEERLGVKLVYTETDYNWDKVANEVRNYVYAGTDEFDLIVNDQRGLSTSSIEKLLINAYDCKYFDFNKPYWWDSYMKDLSITNNNLYLLVGDYFIDVLRKSHVIYYNRNLYTDLYGDPDDLYKSVIAGDWTYDKFISYITESYSDLNGNSKADADDQYGMIIGGVGGSIFPFVYGTEAKFIGRNTDGTPYLDMNNDRMIELYDKVYNAFYSVGTRTAYAENGADLHTKFMSGTSLFISGAGIGDFDVFRDMEDDIGLVPYPKIDENQKDYVTVIHDTAEIGAIPITCKDPDFASAVIQALCEETYNTLIPAYYETALKIKYVRDDYTAQMIDLVHDGISGLFALIYGGAWANDIFTWTFLEPLQAKNPSCTSSYASREKAALKGMEDLLAQYAAN